LLRCRGDGRSLWGMIAEAERQSQSMTALQNESERETGMRADLFFYFALVLALALGCALGMLMREIRRPQPARQTGVSVRRQGDAN
jgi:hypothetical protein